MFIKLSRGRTDHLEPVDEFENSLYAKKFRVLFEGLDTKPVARFAKMPSFLLGYAFSVEQKESAYFIRSNGFRHYTFEAVCEAGARAITISREIDEDLFYSIGQLFPLLMEQTRHPDNLTLGLDGTTYFFSAFVNDEIKTGHVWEPAYDSPMGRLADVCAKIFFISRSDLPMDGIKTEIDELISELRNIGNLPSGE